MLGSLLDQLTAMSQDECLVPILDTVVNPVYELSEDDLLVVISASLIPLRTMRDEEAA